MQLKIRRSQREGGIVSTNAIFCLDARAEFTATEQQNIKRYKLGKQVIYNSEASRKHLDQSAQHHAQGSTSGYLKSIASVAMAAMRLNISIDSLARGQHIECKSLDELLGAEEAIMEACQNLKAYLGTASTFDGREIVLDFANDEPRIVAHATTPDPALIAPPPLDAVPAPIPQLISTSQVAAANEREEAKWQETYQAEPQFSWDSVVEFCRNPANRPKLIAGGVGLLLLLMLFNCHG